MSNTAAGRRPLSKQEKQYLDIHAEDTLLSKYKGDVLVLPKRLNSITGSSISRERSIELQARDD